MKTDVNSPSDKRYPTPRHSLRAWLAVGLATVSAAAAANAPGASSPADPVNLRALRLAVEDLTRTFPQAYAAGAEYLRAIAAFEKELPTMERGLAAGDESTRAAWKRLEQLRAVALLANPLLDFDRLLLVKRDPRNLGLPQNWQGNCALARSGYDNEIAVLSPVRPDGKLTTFFKPDGSRFVGTSS